MEDQTSSTEGTVGSEGQGAEQTAETTQSTGSEAQTNTAEGSEEKLIPIPAKKWRETNQSMRALREEIESLRQSSLNTSSASSDYSQPVDETGQAIANIADAVYARISPVLSQANLKAEQDQAIQEVGNLPHANQFSKEIAQYYTDPDLQNVSPRRRMQMAYDAAIGRNIDQVMKTASETGYQEAYNKIAEKQSASPSPNTQSIREGSEITPDEIRNMPISEYNKKRTELFREFGLGTPSR